MKTNTVTFSEILIRAFPKQLRKSRLLVTSCLSARESSALSGQIIVTIYIAAFLYVMATCNFAPKLMQISGTLREETCPIFRYSTIIILGFKKLHNVCRISRYSFYIIYIFPENCALCEKIKRNSAETERPKKYLTL
jgi:hypothetical protein